MQDMYQVLYSGPNLSVFMAGSRVPPLDIGLPSEMRSADISITVLEKYIPNSPYVLVFKLEK